MSFKPVEGVTQIGWKVWYHDGNVMSVYSSKTDNWDSLPAQGVQAQYRYYQNAAGNKWKESILGVDFYTASSRDLFNLVRNNTSCKLGSDLTHAEFRDKLATARSTAIKPIDDSISRYSIADKRVVGWTLIYEDNSVFSSSRGDVWENAPRTGVIMLLREMKSKSSSWIEQLFNVDLYVLDAQAEIDLVNANSSIKRGLLVSQEALDSTLAAFNSDTEEF